jgi:hypothetical protein
MNQGLLRPLEPVIEYAASDVQQALQVLRTGDHIGKFILNTCPTATITLECAEEAQNMRFNRDGAYLLVGGVSGLGKSIAVWLAERGAKNLVFLSRRAGSSAQSKQLSAELEVLGCSATMVRGSVTKIEDVKAAITAAAAPIKGVFHLAMVQHVCRKF